MFRDHCRQMAAAVDKKARRIAIVRDEDLVKAIALADDADSWTQMADEADRWLEQGFGDDTPEDHTAPLWEEAP